MNKAQNIFGNLALKPIAEHKTVQLRVIEPSRDKRPVYEEIIDQVFTPHANRPFGNEQTAKAYAFSGRPILKTRDERKFAYIAFAVATVAVFYFSFFAFV